MIIDDLIRAADIHGNESGWDYQVGDLEMVLGEISLLLTPRQLKELHANEAIQELLRDWIEK